MSFKYSIANESDKFLAAILTAGDLDAAHSKIKIEPNNKLSLKADNESDQNHSDAEKALLNYVILEKIQH